MRERATMFQQQLTRRESLKIFAGAVSSFGIDEAFNIEALRFSAQILMYHEVVAERMIADCLSFIRQDVQFLSIDDVMMFFQWRKNLDSSTRYALVTCDDGLASQFSAARKAVDTVWKQTRVFVPLTLFVMTKFNDLPLFVEEIPDSTPSYTDGIHRYMTKGELVRMILEGHSVQNHTVNHPLDLPILPSDQRDVEIIVADERIRTLWEIAGRLKTTKAFASPYGRMNQALQNFLGALGFDLAFSTQPSTDHAFTDRRFLGRIRQS